VALQLLRSPNRNPLAQLPEQGVNTEAQVLAIEAVGDASNVVVEYHVGGTRFERSVPLPAGYPEPAIGAQVRIRYLPNNPGLSRLVS
jgi:hypothetical protein